MSKNSVQQALSCFGKNNPPDMLVEEVIFPSFLCILSPFQLIKLPARSVKVILSGASPFNSFYVFPLRLDRLAPPTGERLE